MAGVGHSLITSIFDLEYKKREKKSQLVNEPSTRDQWQKNNNENSALRT